MGVLRNPKHEAFAQAIVNMPATGHTLDECYVSAGYKSGVKNAQRLRANGRVLSRIEEIQRETAQTLKISRERMVLEVARLAFSDMRKAMEWQGHTETVEDNPDGGDVLTRRTIYANRIRVRGSDEIDDDTAAAISEVRSYADGSLGLKMHAKGQALELLAKLLGQLKEPEAPAAGAAISPREVAEFLALPPLERARRMLFAIELIARDNDKAVAEAAKPVQQIEGTTA